MRLGVYSTDAGRQEGIPGKELEEPDSEEGYNTSLAPPPNTSVIRLMTRQSSTHSDYGRRQWRSIVWAGWALAASIALAPQAQAGLIGYYELNSFTLTNTNADGNVLSPDGGLTFILTGGNDGSGLGGFTDLLIAANASGTVQFTYRYASLDLPGFDFAGYLVGSTFTRIADSDGQSGGISFGVSSGQLFGFRIETLDNLSEPGILTVHDFSAPLANVGVPEPPMSPIFLVIAALAAAVQAWRKRASGVLPLLLSTVLAAAAPPLSAQSFYGGSNVTGQLVLTARVNMLQQSQFLIAQGAVVPPRTEVAPKILPRRLRPPQRFTVQSGLSPMYALAPPAMQSLQIDPIITAFGFNGINHAQQRTAFGGNQFSVEPPNPSLAVGNGYVLEGVNNAVQVYDAVTGAAVLPAPIASNQLFGLAPAINWTTGINGVFPTDMRVFYDAGINRWFVLQRALDNDQFGNAIDSSHLYIAVSQTDDPTGTYNIYTMDTTNNGKLGCPCFADYPQIGADEYGFYISANEFSTSFNSFVDAIILAISKASLASGATSPSAFRFAIPHITGYEFAIQPASTPPGASYFRANGGGQFFVSSQASFSVDNKLAVWMMTNTSSLGNANPNLSLTSTLSSVLTYSFPDVAVQRPGPLPYGSGLTPSGVLAYLDGGDNRVLSVSYAGGRLYVTFATGVTDETGQRLVGGAYVVLSPNFRGGVLSTPLLRQGYLLVRGNHLLRPAVALNPRGRGTIAFTLVGPDYYPSAAFVPFDAFSTGPNIQVAAFGMSPEDGFSGYSVPGLPGLARWGDYSAAAAGSDGSIWMVTEYIPNAPRTELANWGTYVTRYVP